MSTKARAAIPSLLLLATLLFAPVAFTSEDRDDPAVRQCLQRCKEEQPRYLQPLCVLRCKDHGHQSGRHDDPKRHLEQCRQQCRQQQQGSEERALCERRCDEEYPGERRGEQGEQGEQGSPYVFDHRSFKQYIRTDHGYVKVLEPFHRQSKLLRNVRNYRVAIMEANPRSFVIPSHSDAHSVCYVVQGRGVVTTIENDEKESYNIREGDIFVMRAGAVVYLVNTDGREKLIIVKIIQTISVPGKFQFFFGPGGRNPESYFWSFSKDILRAAFKTPTRRLERLFGAQKKGVIIRASEEQVRALSRHASEGSHGSHWPLPFGESHGPYNLLDRRAKSSNQHGQIYEADDRDYHKLGELDIRVSLSNITAGSMEAPFYNTQSTSIAVVLEGTALVEIVCPHLAGEERERQGGRSERREEEEEEEEGRESQGYQKIQARVSRGTVFVVPPGHPSVKVASRNGNLLTICFEVRAQKNEKVFLAGANNVLRKLDPEAKELAFDERAKEVDEVLNAQHDKQFVEGPEESRGGEEEEEEGKGHGRGSGHSDGVLETVLRMATAGL